MTSKAELFRERDGDDSHRVSNIELFFDLVFVFAITQLSHRLLAHLTPWGAVEALILFCAMWWLWIYTSWATNWLDPERGIVRFLLMAMMLGGIVLSASIPKAFETFGLPFALIYTVMQIGRTLFIVWASWGHNPARVRNFLRITFYFALALPLWMMGAFAEGHARIGWWAAALAIEYAGPWLFFRTPFLGASTSADWDISGAHMAERCALFIIIALGETIIVTGATYADLTPSRPLIAALAISVAGSAAMWWIYFDVGAKRAGEAIEDDATDTGRLARDAYTYVHMAIVGGIVVSAVADEKMLATPFAEAKPAYLLVACGGPVLFLMGNQAFKWMTAGRRLPPLSHAVGEALIAMVAVAALFAHWSYLATGGAVMAALIVTAAWEWFSLHGGWQRWAPWMGRGTAIALEDTER